MLAKIERLHRVQAKTGSEGVLHESPLIGKKKIRLHRHTMDDRESSCCGPLDLASSAEESAASLRLRLSECK